MVTSVVEAVERELTELGKRDAVLAESALAAVALSLAEQMDLPGPSAAMKSMCAKELREALAALRALAPEEEANDRLDELTARRNRRLAAS